MNQHFEMPDSDGMQSLTVDAVEQALARGDGTAADLLMLYFACLVADPYEKGEFGGVADRVADTLFEMAEAGDEDATMAMTALTTLLEDDGSDDAKTVGVAMFRSVATRPILLNVVEGKMEFESATAALEVIDTLAESLLDGVFDSDEIDDLDIDELAAVLGVSNLDLDWDGDFDDR
jgi:hypothetical protein